MLHLRPDTGFGLFNLFRDLIEWVFLVQFAPLSGAHRHVPCHRHGIRALVYPLIIRIPKRLRLLSVQLAVARGHVIDIARRAKHRVLQP